MRRYHIDGEAPPPGTVFVFGSNLSGYHGGGAARYAYDSLGAEWGVYAGLTGRAYAIPTKDAGIRHTLPVPHIARSIERFKGYAGEHPGVIFWVTRIGCGLAGLDDGQIAPLFADAPDNCNLPYDWRQYYEI